MMIVDSQLHIWAADTPERPWPPGEAARAHQPTPLTAEGLLGQMDAADVARAILVPPSWEGDQNGRGAAERPSLSRTVRRDGPHLAGGAGEPGGIPAADATDGMRGLRFTFHTKEQQKLLTGGAADWLWPAAAAAGVPLDGSPAAFTASDRRNRGALSELCA